RRRTGNSFVHAPRLPELRAPVAIVQARNHHTTLPRGVHELSAIEVDPDVAAVHPGLEEDQIADTEFIASDAAATGRLFVGGARQIDAEHAKGACHIGRAVY